MRGEFGAVRESDEERHKSEVGGSGIELHLNCSAVFRSYSFCCCPGFSASGSHTTPPRSNCTVLLDPISTRTTLLVSTSPKMTRAWNWRGKSAGRLAYGTQTRSRSRSRSVSRSLSLSPSHSLSLSLARWFLSFFHLPNIMCHLPVFVTRLFD